jgi:hypothetical protein
MWNLEMHADFLFTNSLEDWGVARDITAMDFTGKVKLDFSDSGSCLAKSFDISNIEISGSVTRESVPYILSHWVWELK